MASMSNQRASSLVSSTSSSSTPQWKYDVFLSFRGEDTRNKFTDHLYAALNQRGIVVFRDDEKLERGKAIAPELLKAIAESRISIVVFSRNYASSTWCLDELVQIVECMGKKGQVVLPIFYDVNPSEVRKQTGSFQEDFAKHEQVFRENIKKVEEWRTAVTEVANLSGWNIQDRSEAKLIKDIGKEIWCKLICTFPSVADGLVGIDSRLMELNTYLGEGLNDVRFIGICGMGGIGKTTIARVVHEILSRQFESGCFLVNVKEVSEKQGLVPLQNQLLSKVLKEPNINVLNVFEGVDMIKSRLRYRKVLLIVDDVDNLEQLKMLAGDHGWFGPGSRIIITSRDEHLLSVHGVDGIYKATELNYNDSLKLFSAKAFKQNHPAKDYEELSMRVVNYASGLPLVLEVLGSNLCGQSITVWESYLDKLDQIPDNEILKKLKVSFDCLDKLEKKIFLDIACFFKRCNRDHVTKILDACGFFSCCGIQKLIDKSLIKTIGNELWMHDQLQYMGMEIVHRECTEEPGKRSRLWAAKDVNHVLTKNTGTDAVETMVIDLPERIKAQWNVDYFSKMSKLRLLKIHNVDLNEGPKCLSNELRCLEWHGYPSKFLPSTFHLDKLVELNMCYSGIKQLWKGKEALENLKFITLSHSQHLTKTPDFTGIPNLERLILKGCTRLCEVHPSIGLLKKLTLLNLKDCRSLRGLPSNIEMESLEKFVLSGCSKLKKFPEITGKMKCLSKLHLDGTAIEELPSAFHPDKLVELNMCYSGIKQLWKGKEALENLKFITLSHSQNLTKTPDFTGSPNLERLILEGCTRLCEVHPSIGLLKKLILLNLKDCRNLRSLPSNIEMESIEELILSSCSKVKKFPEITGKMECLSKLHLDGTAIEELPASIERLKGLVLLNLRDCKNLVRLPSNINGLKSLKTLNLAGCFKLENVPENLREVECLEELDVSGTALRQPQSAIVLLKNLKVLSFRGCKATPSSSWQLQFPFLSERKKPMPLILPSLSGLCSLTNLDLSDCNLGEGAIPNDIGCLSSLKILNLSSNNLVSLPTSINRLSRLYELNVENCKRLKSLPELSSDQVHVEASDCTSLEMLPDPLKQCSTEEPEPQWLAFYCVSCFKLLENQGCSSMATRLLKRYLQRAANRRAKFDFVIPGNKIPEWFSYQTEGNEVTLQSSLHLNNKNKLIAFVVCSTFVVHRHSPAHDYTELHCVPHADDKEINPRPFFRLEHKLGQAVPDHLWLVYIPRANYYFFSRFDKASHLGFKICSSNPYLKVKKLGVYPIYEQGVGTSTFENFIDLLDDFDGSTTLDGAMIKRINDEAGPSGSDCFEDEPHPKRFKY